MFYAGELSARHSPWFLLALFKGETQLGIISCEYENAAWPYLDICAMGLRSECDGVS